MKYEIMNNGPIVCKMDVYHDYFFYKEGIYKYVAGKYAGGHAVRLIG